MTPEQITLVQQTYTKVVSIESVRGRLAQTFAERLFQMEPSLRPVFTGRMAIGPESFLSALGIVVKGINELPALVAFLQEAARSQALLGLQEEHYTSIGRALLQSLEIELGSDFTLEARDAWTAAYTALATVMIRAARQVPSAA